MRMWATGLAPVALSLALAACGGGAAAPASAPPSAPASAATSAKPAASASAGASANAKPAASGGAIPSIPAGQKVKIVTATGVPSAVFTPVWIAIDNGLFAKYGLDASLQDIEGVKQAQAIIAGDVQIGNVGGAEVLNSDVGGAKLEAIVQTTASPVFELHADPQYKKVADLKGKTIAITQNGSSTDMAARVLLKNHGLNPDSDVKLLNAANMPGILAAMVSHQVQGGVASPPTTIKANDAGFPMVASAVAEHVPLQNNLTVLNKPYADQHPEVVYAYLEAELDGLQVTLNNPDVAVVAIAKHTNSDEKTARAAYEAFKPAIDHVGLVTEDGLKTVQQYAGNPKLASLNLSTTYDNSFLQNLRASGFYDKIGLK
jgi:NitT/TauT family transport system substrate-binding protein